MKFAIIENGVVTNVVLAGSAIADNWIQSDTAGVGNLYDSATGLFSTPPVVAPITVANPTEFLIDVGPFFDRFKTAKMPILVSTNATVKAIVTDLQVRKWVDLKRTDVAQGIDVLIALNVSGVTTALKNDILNLPVTPDENLALRKLYFS